MTKSGRAAYILTELEKRYPVVEVPLDHSDPFTLLVSVVLSAQCTDERVNRITPLLFARASDPHAMAAMSVDEIERIIRPCGLSPAKSKNIRSLSQQLIDQHNGLVPDNFEALEALPGVGHKTASVVMAQAFGVPAFPVDTHIHRLLTRWKMTSGKNVVQTERDAKKYFPESSWNKLHLQIIFYGREFSPARGATPDRDYITAHLNPSAFRLK
ncbi:MAG: endonuclease III [Flavobacteriales bacterium]|nr:endonuclease III [Flavobacteriales bacterium]